jgi:hypothetical protein
LSKRRRWERGKGDWGSRWNSERRGKRAMEDMKEE